MKMLIVKYSIRCISSDGHLSFPKNNYNEPMFLDEYDSVEEAAKAINDYVRDYNSLHGQDLTIVLIFK